MCFENNLKTIKLRLTIMSSTTEIYTIFVRGVIFFYRNEVTLFYLKGKTNRTT